ncbi:MAG TPA: hypothetical protein VK428_12765 [Acidimicrobiales bacterium]|nr:hypothetical protein [Acidimicrobiales bacterium]
MPDTARAITRRCTSEVPSKMVCGSTEGFLADHRQELLAFADLQ